MEGIFPPGVLLLILLQTPSAKGQICSAPSPVNFPENNNIGDLVVTVTAAEGVRVGFDPPAGSPFRLEGNRLVATAALDYEENTSHVVQITCVDPSDTRLTLNIIILVENKNDNPPQFDQTQYRISVNELLPVDTSVGSFAATDRDQPPQLFYTLTAESDFFRLRSLNNPEILTNSALDYDRVKEVQLVLTVQDTPLGSAPGEPSFTATATITVAVLDVDNRPPWFQPCERRDLGGSVVCQNAGYTGKVALNEQETGVLPLNPGPLHAIDGDFGINEDMMYLFLSGNEDGLFEINPNTGNISMLRPADVLGPISLTVMASQRINSHQFATAPLTITVTVKSLHPPRFQRPRYEALATSVGSMASDLNHEDQPLQILATDEDYAATGGLNPHITYTVVGNSDFSVIGGFLFMTRELLDAQFALEVVATDTENDETATAQLIVEVRSSVSTTRVPLSTTGFQTSSPTEESTSGPTSPSPSGATGPSLTTDGSSSSASTPLPVVVPSGEFGAAEMAALGATLGLLLFVCVVVIALLVHRMKRGKADSKKIYEASMFRSSLGRGSGGQKEGIQYTNEAFQREEEDRESSGSGARDSGGDTPAREPIGRAADAPPPPAPPQPDDDADDDGSDQTERGKEVRPILTKEKRAEDGYKSVWFREDIDPESKREVVIIPQEEEEEEEEQEEEEEEQEEEEEEEDGRRRPRVLFSDPDLDSGLGVKMEDRAEDSDSDKELNVNL